MLCNYLFGFRRHNFVPNPESGVALVAQVIGIRIDAGRVILDERQPDSLVAGTPEVVFARRVWWQRMSGAVQQAPVGVVERIDEELALAGVLGVAGRFVVDEQYLKRQDGHVAERAKCHTNIKRVRRGFFVHAIHLTTKYDALRKLCKVGHIENSNNYQTF